MDDRISELPDDILSSILTMLSIKDLLKTSVLSKRWCKLWGLRKDLYFDIHNVLGTEIELLEKRYLVDVTRYSRTGTDRCVNLDLSLKEFVKRVDQFLKNFHGTTIDSLLINFYLESEQSNTIDQWIRFAIVRGVERINLLFLGRPYVHRTTENKHYKFDPALFCETNASTLKHLRLEYCLVCHPTNLDFTPFKNLRSLSLRRTKLDEMFIESLLSNCRHLEELCLVFCVFKSSMPKIVSSSLCHLEILSCYLLSKENYQLDTLNLNTPVLKNINFSISLQELNAFVTLCTTFPELEIMHLDIILKVTTSLKITQPLKHLKQLNLMIYNPFILDNEYDPLWILNILRASPLLQKLKIMYTNSYFVTNQKDIRDVEMFSHDEIKVIELGGCVGNWFEIEFVINVLKYAHKLEQIIVSPYWREGEPSDSNHDPEWFQSGRKRMSEKLQEAIGREKLVLV
ncbi:hypothetical protein P8452_68033 [Trifolium repens]|nr:hypothetical protein P8452_68025 [Trifolium repens]WJX85602.1 hypothetical protein P8452_68029 [Trifolium repens]WJX85608.1 hypothetical protein P8452_68033 [Trifolium repens]